MIVLVDMNCFFAQIEQQDYPFWRNRPVAVTNGRQGTTIITASYEARNYGVRTGMRLKQARELCPDLIQAPSRPYRYAEISTRIMDALQAITPDVEVYSVDEAFLDVTACQKLHGNGERSIGPDMQRRCQRRQDHGQVRGQAPETGRPYCYLALGSGSTSCR
jgi:DNA polymerase-4